MKWIFIISTILCFSFGCNSKTTSQTKERNLVLKAVYKGIYFIPQDDTFDYCLVEIKLVNNTDTTCEFVAFNSLPSYNITTDSKHVEILGNICGSNYPIKIRIKPNQTFRMPVILQTKRNSPAINKEIKFGLVLLQFNDWPIGSDFRYIIYKMKQNDEHVIWSVPITLYPGGGAQYEIEDN